MPESKLTWLTFNMQLNKLISTYLDDGGDPARIADLLQQVATEVFDTEPDLRRDLNEQNPNNDMLEHDLWEMT